VTRGGWLALIVHPRSCRRYLATAAWTLVAMRRAAPHPHLLREIGFAPRGPHAADLDAFRTRQHLGPHHERKGGSPGCDFATLPPLPNAQGERPRMRNREERRGETRHLSSAAFMPASSLPSVVGPLWTASSSSDQGRLARSSDTRRSRGTSRPSTILDALRSCWGGAIIERRPGEMLG
jgi:hypothetical protein